ncbi:MAG: GntR family transcriptional regulator [Lachnospiraceae bacterium]|jgi:DNA-binding FadR family transcriptional regulator|nr:GntR family transcriptional regulator [Lachnospiraceae bacterium]
MEGKKPILSESLQSKSVVDQIMDKIVAAIIQGELHPGDKLPTEMELCRDLGVGRNSVREAIKKLEAYGAVYIKRAEGTFISEQYHHRMLDPMLYGLILQQEGWVDLLELRMAMDIGTLYMVIRKGVSHSQIRILKENVASIKDELYKPVPSMEKLVRLDREFHDRLVTITGNGQLENIIGYIGKITIPNALDTTLQIVLEKGKERYVEVHQQIVDVILSKDSSRIEQVVLDHYSYWQDSSVFS